ncbi:conserved hypothetical protein [Tenacibaculum maritimum]|uniref:hypothetical protein n=1 Tax=Tenacibaculum maritimum TaxID=107401 RepID=UPI0012E46672|nr:hypothetical protein [Tenacibaculum maritimum]CAA0163192.1 conserved hypothetical protein [Tenacibaculum maritimum]CAA0173397.1 hypothetical protein FS0810_140034 [Tenacibaculum maritimum]
MIVLNDIWLVNYLKIFEGLFKKREILISNLYMGGYSLSIPEKQFIKELDEEGKIGLFETDLGFYNLIEENSDKGLIGNSNAASIYYAKLNNYPLITQDSLISLVCEENNVVVYNLSQALKILNIADDKIDFIEKIINIETEKI